MISKQWRGTMFTKVSRIIAIASIMMGVACGTAFAQANTTAEQTKPVETAPMEGALKPNVGNTAKAIQQEDPENKNQAEVNVGRIDFTDPTKSDKGHAVDVRIGKRTNTQMKLYREQLLGKHVIGIDTHFQAGGTEPVHVAYYVVFQNASGTVIGASSGNDEIEPGTDYGWNNSGIIALPEKRFNEIAYYQVVLYESDQPIGTVGAETKEDVKEN